MKDHPASPGANARYLALRDRRRRLFLPPVVCSSVAPDADTRVILPPPIIHGIQVGGLRRDQLLGDFATVQVTVGPWDYPALTDHILLRWGDQWAQTFPVKDTNGAQLLTIPGADIAGDPLGNGDHYSGEGLQAVRYQIHTEAGSITNSTVTEVRVKTARPGGEDPRPDTPINDNLVAPTAVPDPVAQDTAEVTFSVSPWANLTTDDRLTLVLAGYRFDFPAVSNPTAVQTLTLTAAQIAATGGGPRTPVTYEIIDAVGNRSGYAPYLLLDIWLESGERLEMIELFDGARLPLEGAIDPAMTDGFARVPRYVGWQNDKTVTVILDGVASDGQEHLTTLGPLAWNATDYYLDFALPGDALMILAGGIVRVHYETNTGGIAYRRLYVVDALPEIKLPPVIVIGEQGGELPLDAITGDYVSIVIPDSEAFVDFARITLSMAGTGNGGPVHDEEIHNVGDGEGHTPYTFTWLKTRVKPLLDHTAIFSYTIRTLDTARAGDTPRLYRPTGIRDSEPHELLIRQTGSPGQLAAPLVHDLVDGALSPALPKLKLTVPDGPASLFGAEVKTTVAGLTTDTHTHRIFEDHETIVIDFPDWPADNDGAPAKAWYTIGDKTSQEANFRVGVVEPFTFAPSPVTLIGTQSYTRNASGGTPPYTYTSSVPGVVAVSDPAQGLIQGVADGTATITAHDSATPQASGSYPVTVTGNTLVLLRPEPDVLGSDGRIDINQITDPRGLRVVVKQFQGMAVGQTVTLTCIHPNGNITPAAQQVIALRDYEFFLLKSDIQRLVNDLNPAVAGMRYTVTATGINETSPRNEVTFYQTLLTEDFEQVLEDTRLMAGQSLVLPTMEIWASNANTKWIGSIDFTSAPKNPPEIKGRSMSVAIATAKLVITCACSQLSFGFLRYSASHLPVTFVAHDADGLSVAEVTVTADHQFVTLAAPAGQRIGSVTMSNFAILDNFTFRP